MGEYDSRSRLVAPVFVVELSFVAKIVKRHCGGKNDNSCFAALGRVRGELKTFDSGGRQALCR